MMTAPGFWVVNVLLLAHLVVARVLAGRLPAHQRSALGMTRTEWAALWLLLTVSLLLRLPGLNEGLWYDEIQTLVDYVRQPWGVLLTTFENTNQHLLYSVVARAAFSIAGESAAALRLPAVLFGVATLWAALMFGRRWLAPREAWWTAILLAVSYHHVWFSQNARGYTGLLLGTLVSSTLFLDMLRGAPPTARRVWSYALVLALTLLTHVTALVVVAAHGLCWLGQVRRLPPGPGRWGPFVALGLAGSLALTAYAPVLPQLLTAVSASGTGPVATEWQRPAWLVMEALRGMGRGVPGGFLAVPAVLLVAFTGLASAWRRDRLVTSMMVLPLLIMAALVLATGHNLWPRFFFFGAAFLVTLAIRGGFAILEHLVPAHAGRIGGAGLALAVIGSLALLPRAWEPKQDYEAAVAWLGARVEPGDAIVATEMMDLPMNRWLGQGWPVVRDAAALQEIEPRHGRTWVLYTFPIRLSALSPELWARLEADYRPAHSFPGTVGEGAVVIVARPAVSPGSRP